MRTLRATTSTIKASIRKQDEMESLIAHYQILVIQKEYPLNSYQDIFEVKEEKILSKKPLTSNPRFL